MTIAEIVERMGIQSYCFREWLEIAVLIEKLQECGFSRTEAWVKHLDPTGDVDAVLKQLANAGISVTATGVSQLGQDEEASRKVLELAKTAGCEAISVDFKDDDAVLRGSELLKEYGVKGAIHNHGRNHWLGSSVALEDVFSKTGPEVGLCLDTAWALDSGEDPVGMARKFMHRLYGMHLKDFVFDEEGNLSDVIVGTGGVDLPALLGLLAEREYQGYVTLEYEGNFKNPVPALKECIATIKACA